MTKLSFDDCSATGFGCLYQEELVPSEFVTGVEGGEPIKVVQCKYCGKPKEVSDE